MMPLAVVPHKPAEASEVEPTSAFAALVVLNANLAADNAKLLHAIHRDCGGMDERAPNDGRRSIAGSASWAALRESRRGR